MKRQMVLRVILCGFTLCNEKHRLIDCCKLKMKPVKERIVFGTKQKIWKNCFPKNHLWKYCICSMNCSADGFSKIYHTLLHLENPYEAVFISTNKHDFSKSDEFYPFLQVISIKVTYVVNTTVVTALLNSVSDATLIASEVTKILKLKGNNEGKHC